MNAKTDSTEAIDRAVKAAKERATSKGSTAPTTAEGAAASEQPAKAAAKPKLTDEEKAAKQAAKDADRAAKKLAREQARAAKKLEREANKKPAHLSKVAKAASKLPSLSDEAQVSFDTITANFGRDMVAAIALHLQHFNRAKATERSLGQKLNVGDQVSIVGGDPRYAGMTGTVVKSQRIRCYVNIPGANNRPVPGTEETGVYFFSSDVDVTAAAAQKTGTEG